MENLVTIVEVGAPVSETGRNHGVFQEPWGGDETRW